uniref:TLC domain-containing protein n=1 Tax=Gongylonema pulchrum TaxID=637853 RepID=A0A183ENB6_9BILA
LRQLPMMPRFFVLMLLCLLVLHIYWTYIILKIAIKSVQGNIDDIREESDDETPSSSSPLRAEDGFMKNNTKKADKLE